MKKIKYLLATMVAMVGLGVQAQTDTEYDAALAAITSGSKYCIVAEYNSSTYYLKTDGYLTDNLAEAGVFTFIAATVEGGFKATGFKSGMFTNGGDINNNITGDNLRRIATSSYNRDGWEAQVYFLNETGYYAIRSTNAVNSSWGASAFWTIVDDNDNDGLPNATYTVDVVPYIWKLQDGALAEFANASAEYQSVKATIVAWTTSEVISNADEAKATLNTALAVADSKANAATTTDEMNEAITDLKAAGKAFLENVTFEGGLDITNAWITNYAPGISGNTNGWTNSGSPSLGSQLFEYWNIASGSTKQILSNLPKGAYKLTAIAYTRDDMVAKLYAGEATTNLVTVANSIVNTRDQGDAWIAQGNGVNNLSFILNETTATLEIGLIADNTTADYWMCWRSFTLTYYGDATLWCKSLLTDAVAAAQAVEGKIPSGLYSSIAVIIAEKNKEYNTAEEYSAAATAINETVSTYATTEIENSYARYKSIKAAILSVSAAINTSEADTAVATATTSDDIEAAIAMLRAGFLAELPNLTIPAEGIDVTAVIVDNASVGQNTNYWTALENGSARTGDSWALCNYDECEFYNNNFKFYQTLTLVSGTWELGVTGFHRAGNHNTYLYAGDDKILFPSVESSIANTMAESKTYFDNGNGKVALKFLVEAAGNIEIGIDNQDTETDKWTIFRNFTLKYYGAPDYSDYEAQWNAAVAAANTAKSNAINENVTGAELSGLNAAIADAPDGSSSANYLEKLLALESAIETFNAAAKSYNAYVAYKAETIALFGTDFEVAVPTTAAEADNAIHALNVAQYNKVATDYTFSATNLIGDIGTWNGTATVAGEAATPGTLSEQHWSGQTHAYYEQAANGWSNTNGWTIRYEKKCILPAGDYVIKVAARSSRLGEVTSLLSCSATNQVLNLPNNGDSGRGIKLNGEAGWDGENNEFANDGEGYGWQWHFLPFTLTEQSEVTMTLYAETTTQHQWVSYADAELLSTKEISPIEIKLIADNKTREYGEENPNLTYTTHRQSWDIVSGNVYYIRNVECGQFITGANSWATQISLSNNMTPYLKVVITEASATWDDGAAEGYTIALAEDHYFTGDHNHVDYLVASGKQLFRDSEESGFVDLGSQNRGFIWSLTKTGEYYYIQTADGDPNFPDAANQYAAATSPGSPVVFNASIHDSGILWQFIPVDEVNGLDETLLGIPQLSCNATTTSPVGLYDIVVSKGTVTYDNATFVNGTLTITKAPLKVEVAETYTCEEGEPIPNFILTYNGWKLGESENVLTQKPSATTTATVVSRAGTYPITISGGSAQNYELNYVPGTLTITALPLSMLGDVNRDGKVSVGDVVLTANHLLGRSPSPFNVRLADVDNDGQVDVADLVEEVNKIADQMKVNASFVKGQWTEQDEELTGYLHNGQMSILLENGIPYTAFQMTLTVPEGTNLDDVTATLSRTTNHQIGIGKLNERQLRIIAYSFDNQTFTDNAEPIFKMKGIEGDILVDDILFVTTDGQKHRFTPISISPATGIAEMYNGRKESEKSVSSIYDITGRLMPSKVTKSGLYINKGKKMMIR